MIPEALARAPRISLPDHSGYWLLLGTDDGTPCPQCRRAMGLAIVHQVIDVAKPPHVTTEYSCVSCSTWCPPTPPAADLDALARRLDENLATLAQLA